MLCTRPAHALHTTCTHTGELGAGSTRGQRTAGWPRLSRDGGTSGCSSNLCDGGRAAAASGRGLPRSATLSREARTKANNNTNPPRLLSVDGGGFSRGRGHNAELYFRLTRIPEVCHAAAQGFGKPAGGGRCKSERTGVELEVNALWLRALTFRTCTSARKRPGEAATRQGRLEACGLERLRSRLASRSDAVTTNHHIDALSHPANPIENALSIENGTRPRTCVRGQPCTTT